ncbi:putative cruciform DNA binding protein [Fimicolochytrium jonesii]|uniref:putative cruciform DNA binding protein n=1 Tax=Fimicolochytrium jonesii TaxID=1396493 RepID=UPI0022FF368A|nr:putative cruciform DNA binding protein [Fimicolochytrium jonesii]KAI8820384.1 putative cruciform DNA binding protein [Fimicolochytrium jonesii]
MSAPSKTHGNIQAATGAVKETIGATVGNQSLRAEGAAQRASGNAEVEGVKAKNYASGAVDGAVGNIKKNVGDAVGNQSLHARGAGQEAHGDAQKALNK